MRATVADRAFARANLYRFLSLGFAYPTADVYKDIERGTATVIEAARVLPPDIQELVSGCVEALCGRARGTLAAEYRQTFTFSASPDCPLNECAYGSRHIYQEVQDLADVSAFYRAFGLEIAGDRPDSLAAELEFCALLALKEGLARDGGRSDQASISREGTRLFLRDHLGRWAENIGRRIELLAPDTAYALLGRLLAAFAAWDLEAMRVGPVEPYQEVPRPPEPIDDETCPAEEGLGVAASRLQDAVGNVEILERANI